jgi:hypothetical protein
LFATDFDDGRILSKRESAEFHFRCTPYKNMFLSQSSKLVNSALAIFNNEHSRRKKNNDDKSHLRTMTCMK